MLPIHCHLPPSTSVHEPQVIASKRMSANLAMPVVIAGVYGIAMQMVEVNVPGLPTEILRVFTDIGGAILSIAVMVRIWPRIKRLGRAAAAQL